MILGMLADPAMVDPGSMLGHLLQSVPGLLTLTNVVVNVVGVALVFMGLAKFRDLPPHGNTKLVTPILWILVGVALINLYSSLQSGLGTFFGGSADVNNLLAYSGGALPSAGRELVQTLIVFVRLFGLWAAIRGLMVLRHVGDPNYAQKDPLKTGLMRFVFGCFLFNIVQTLNVLAYSFGLGHPLT